MNIQKNKPFQLLPDLSLLMLGDVGQLLVFLPENNFFVGVNNRMEASFEKRLNNPKNKVNYISIDKWKILRAKAEAQSECRG